MIQLRLAAAALLAGLALSACGPSDPAQLAACGPGDVPAAAPSGGGLAIQPLQFTCKKLPNGLRLYAMPDPNTASVSIAIWYDVGSKNDPAGRSGFAHLFEHIMFKSTKNLPPESFDRLTEDVGGFNNASTNSDYTNYYETVPANHMERVLWAEAERMGSLVVDEASFKSERAVVQEELRQSVLSNPYGKLFYLYLDQTAYGKHPYGRTTIGSIEDLDAATVEDVRAFHAAYYRPDNAVLVVSGNFDEAQLEGYVKKYFAGIPTPKREIPRVTVEEPIPTAARTFTTYEANVELPAVTISWPIPAAKADADHAALEVMDAILQTGQSSRLYQSMVYDQQLAAQVGSNSEDRQQASVYTLLAILSAGKTPEEGLKSLNAEIAKMRDTQVTQAELDEAKNEIITGVLDSRETSDGRADELATSIVQFRDPQASDKLLGLVQAVTAADVQRVAKALMDDSRSITIRYLPKDGDKAGDTIGVSKDIETVKIDIPAAEIPTFTLAAEDKREKPPAAGPAVAAKVPAATEKTLPNGLRVIVAPKPGLPLLSASLRISAGGALDPATQSGLASMTADLVTRGTTTRSATEISRQIESLGAAIGASAGADASDVSVSARSDNAKQVLEIMADVVQHPAFADAEIARAKQETMDGLTVSLGQPSSVGRFAMTRALFGGSPYGGVVSQKSVKSITRKDMVAFHDGNWRPDQSVLVITGAISADEGFALAEGALGQWKAEGAAAKAATPAPAALPPKPRALVIDMPEIGQAAVLFGRTGPARTAGDYFPTLVANDVLGGGYSARLNAEIRIKRGLSYGAGSSLASRKQPAPIVASAQTRNDAVPQVIDLMTGEFTRLGAEPIAASEMDARKAYLIGSFGRSVETTAGLAGQLSALAQFGLPLDKLQTYASDISAVTAEQAQAAAKANYDPANATLIVVGDAAKFWDQVKDKRGGMERLDIKKLNLNSPTLK